MARAGHNSKAQAGPIDHAKLKSYVERIEAVESEEADYKAAKKDIYVEVKAAGMRPKMVRKIVKERKKTEADAEEEAELELYRAALAMPGATFRSVSAQTGIPKSTLQRLVPRNKNGTSAPQPEDGDDGITESREEGANLLAVAAEQPSVPSGPAEQSVTPCLPPGGESPVTTEGKARDSANTSPGGPEVARVAPPASDLEMPPIPDFLRRQTEAGV